VKRTFFADYQGSELFECPS